MATPAQKRLQAELKTIITDPPAGVSVQPSDSTILHWTAIIFGPYNTPFENGVFNLSLAFTEDFPNSPPLVRFMNPKEIFHPNIYACGSICLDILQQKWSPTFSVGNILTGIQSLLSDPNPESPANREAAKLYKENRLEYDNQVRTLIISSQK